MNVRPNVLTNLDASTVAAGFIFNHNVLGPSAVPWSSPDHLGRAPIVDTSCRLVASDERLVSWSTDVGVARSNLDENHRSALLQKLDAAVARLLGLTADELRHVYETFHTGWNAEGREAYTEAVLEHLASFNWDPAPIVKE